MYHPPGEPPFPPPPPLSYATRDTSDHGRRLSTFWTVVTLFGGFLFLISTGYFGDTSPWGIHAQAGACLWLIAVCLRLIKHRLQYLFVGCWLVLCWPAAAYTVGRYVHFLYTVGREGPGGQGSPLAFEINFCFHVGIFLPLTMLLVHLILSKPWRAAGPHDESSPTGDALR